MPTKDGYVSLGVLPEVFKGTILITGENTRDIKNSLDSDTVSQCMLTIGKGNEHRGNIHHQRRIKDPERIYPYAQVL